MVASNHARTSLICCSTAAEGIRRGLPGAEFPVNCDELATLIATSTPPSTARTRSPFPDCRRRARARGRDRSESTRPRMGESVRVPVRRVHGLLDVVGEAELEVRRVERFVHELSELSTEQVRLCSPDPCSRDRHLAEPSLTSPTPCTRWWHSVTSSTPRCASCGELWRMLRTAWLGCETAPWGWRWSRSAAWSQPSPSSSERSRPPPSKDVALRLVGEDVELDTRVLDGVADALRHLVTNAVDHGCETPAERVAVGKPHRRPSRCRLEPPVRRS